jgi:alpha-beta hydrolase superfamily lysophospholipase
MQHLEGRFSASDGLELYYQHWRPESEPRAVVALVHGVGEHSGRYGNMVGPLVEAGYAVYGYDQRGHGMSPGPRVHIVRWAEYREDLRSFLALVAEQLPDRPIFLYGHSMGSLVALDYLMDRPAGVAGAIISGVATEPAGVGGPAVKATAKLLSGIVPRFSVDLGIDANDLTRDPEELALRLADPLVTSRATVRWGAESLATVERVKAGSARIDVPLLIIHGEADPLNMVAGAHALYAAVRRPDKTLHVYPGARHEVHNDFGHEAVAADIKEWLAHLVNAEA